MFEGLLFFWPWMLSSSLLDFIFSDPLRAPEVIIIILTLPFLFLLGLWEVRHMLTHHNLHAWWRKTTIFEAFFKEKQFPVSNRTLKKIDGFVTYVSWAPSLEKSYPKTNRRDGTAPYRCFKYFSGTKIWKMFKNKSKIKFDTTKICRKIRGIWWCHPQLAKPLKSNNFLTKYWKNVCGLGFAAIVFQLFLKVPTTTFSKQMPWIFPH